MKNLRRWIVEPGKTAPFARMMGVVLRAQLTYPNAMLEAEAYDVPFTPIWWWWNPEADEYVLTLWDTEAGKDKPAMYSFGTSDPTGTFGRPTKMIVPPSLRNAARKLLNNK